MRNEIFENIVEAVTPLFPSGKVVSESVSIKDVGQSLNDSCLIVLNKTAYNYSGQYNLYAPEMELELVVFVPEGIAPMVTQISKEDEVVAALLSDPTRGGKASSTTILMSSSSNIAENYKVRGSVSFVLRILVAYSSYWY
jgi:hypothetical protein